MIWEQIWNTKDRISIFLHFFLYKESTFREVWVEGKGFMKNSCFKIFLIFSLAVCFLNCSDDSSSSSSGVSDLVSSSSVESLNQYPVLSPNGYFVYADGSVKDATGELVGTFTEGTIVDLAGNILESDIVKENLPYFTGTYIVAPDGNVSLPDGTIVGTISNGNVVLGDGTVVDLSGKPVESPESSSALIETPTLSSGVEPSLESSSSTETECAPNTNNCVTPVESSSSMQEVVSPGSDISSYPVASYKDLLTQGGQGTGWSSRYWDACKPHCSWPGNVDTTSEETYQAGLTTARNCNINDVEIPTYTLSKDVSEYWTGYAGTTSACTEASDGGANGAFTCTDMAPIAVNDTLSYAFVAAPGSQAACGKCFHLQYNGGNHANDIKATHKALKGKHLIVMASNIGHDVEVGQFDMMVPGGGVGAFDALSTQIGVSKDQLGAGFGGFLTECQQSLGWDNTVEAYQNCIIEKCDLVFPNHPNLLRGCKWFAEWYMAADNPTYVYEEIDCPQYLVDKYKTTINTTKITDIQYRSEWKSYTGGDL